MVSPLTHWATVASSYLLRGEAGLAAVEADLESTAHDQPGGKFGKGEAVYLPQAPLPPTLWRTSCGRCRFWEEGAPGEPGRCHIVGREEDRFGGEAIHYRGWCAFWMPPRGEPPLAWVRERLRPDGRSSVRGLYDPEVTERKRRRNAGAPVRTEPDARRAAIEGGEDNGGDGGGEGDGPNEPRDDTGAGPTGPDEDADDGG